MSKGRRPAAKKGGVSNPVRARARAKPAIAAEAAPKKNSGGRPSSYGPEVAAAICNHISEGRSLRSFCQGEGAPHKTTVLRWLKEHDEFREAYQVARELQADMLADEVIDIADQADDANIARLKIDARKWTAAKLAPKKYGDKTELDGKVQLEDVTPRPTLPSREAMDEDLRKFRQAVSDRYKRAAAEAEAQEAGEADAKANGSRMQ